MTSRTDVIFHIASLEDWKKSLEMGEYICPSLKSEGFIHFSTSDQVVSTANRHYIGTSGLVLLRVDVPKLSATIKYELAANGEIYPHLYGPLNLDAVEKVVDFPPNPDGTFSEFPDQIL